MRYSLNQLQLDVLTRLAQAGPNGDDAYGLRAGLNTLEALVNRGLAEYRPKAGDLFFPRNRDFVITAAGYQVLNARAAIEPKVPA